MRTEKQIAASRANGTKSRGPKPRPANPWADYRALGEALLIEGESPGLFDDLSTLFAEHLQPQSPIDHLLIGNMLAAHWRKTRLWRREQQKGDPIGIEETRLDRQFYRAYDRYIKSRLNPPREEPPNQTPVSTCENPEPAPEPTETQPEPDETQPQPDPRPLHDTSPDQVPPSVHVRAEPQGDAAEAAFLDFERTSTARQTRPLAGPPEFCYTELDGRTSGVGESPLFYWPP